MATIFDDFPDNYSWPNAAGHVGSDVWAFEVVIGVSRQIEYDWFSILPYDMVDALQGIFMCTQKLTNSQLNLPHGTKRKKTVMKKQKKTTNKNRSGQKKWSVIKSVELVLGPKGSPWWERFSKEVGRQPRVKERELWMVRVLSWHSEKMW